MSVQESTLTQILAISFERVLVAINHLLWRIQAKIECPKGAKQLVRREFVHNRVKSGKTIQAYWQTRFAKVRGKLSSNNRSRLCLYSTYLTANRTCLTSGDNTALKGKEKGSQAQQESLILFKN